MLVSWPVPYHLTIQFDGYSLQDFFQELDELYREVLLRPVDPSGFHTYSAILKNGEVELGDIEAILKESEEYARLARASTSITSFEFPHRSPGAVVEAIRPYVEGRRICDLGCGEGDNMVFLGRYAESVIGMELSDLRTRQARARGFEVTHGDYWRDPVPSADVYYIWPNDGGADVEYLISRLLDNDEFNGTILVAGDASILIERVMTRRASRYGELISVPFDEGTGERQKGIMLLAIIEAGVARQRGRQRPAGNKRVVATLALGSEMESLAAVTLPGIEAYADSINTDLCVVTQRTVQGPTPFYEVFQMERLFEYYDRLLYIDLDVIVRDDTPDLFELVSEEDLGAFLESRYQSKATVDFFQGLRMPETSHDGKPPDHFNNGIMVLSVKHKALFRPPVDIPESAEGNDQAIMNIRAAQEGFRLFDIGQFFNYMVSMLDSSTTGNCHDAWMIHYGSLPLAVKIEQARQDLTFWSNHPRGYLSATGNRVFFGLLVQRNPRLEGGRPVSDSCDLQPSKESTDIRHLILECCGDCKPVRDIVDRLTRLFETPAHEVESIIFEEIEHLLDEGALVAMNQYCPGNRAEFRGEA